MKIERIAHQDIDKTKWNSCVHYATNGNIFGYKWYLDTVAKEWDALVEGDYESVLPLFVTEIPNRLQQPTLIREAGIYSIHLLSPKRTSAFLEAIPSEYEQVAFQLNEGIKPPDSLAFPKMEQRNYQLFLQDTYEQLREAYLPRAEQDLKLAEAAELIPASTLKPEIIAKLYRDEAAKSPATEQAFHAYQRIMYNALHRGWGSAQGITDRQGQLLAATFILYSHGRAMILLLPAHPDAEKTGAKSLLIDNLLRSHAGRPMILDFNSSNLFAERFGARSVPYYRIANLEQSVSKPWWKVW